MANVYTRLRSSGPSIENTTIKTVDTSYPVYTELGLSYSNTVSRSDSNSDWVGDVSFSVISISKPGPWSILGGQSITESFTVDKSVSGNVPAACQARAYDAFIAKLDQLMKEDENGFVDIPFPLSGNFAEIHDVPTKNFKKKVAAGKIINNPVYNSKTHSVVSYVRRAHGHLKFELGVGPSFGYYHNKAVATWTETQNETIFHPPSNSVVEDVIASHRYISVPDTLVDVKQIAINTAFGNINSGAFAYLEELGEAKETVAYIASVLARIASLVKGVKRGQYKDIVPNTHRRVKRKAIRKARQNGTTWEKEYALIALDFITSAWMELRFAIRPLVFSIEDAIKLHQEGLKSSAGRVTVNGMASTISYDTIVQETDDGVIRTVTTTFIEGRRKARGGVILQVDTLVADMRTLGFTNLAGTAWELTFLSWAIDYFINLDGLLYHLTPDIGVQQLGAWSSTDDVIIIKTEISQYDSVTGEALDSTYITSERSLYQREPVEKPSLITINVNIDVQKIADLGSLFYGLLRSTKGVIK